MGQKGPPGNYTDIFTALIIAKLRIFGAPNELTAPIAAFRYIVVRVLGNSHCYYIKHYIYLTDGVIYI